jgi:hypothetical protein
MAGRGSDGRAGLRHGRLAAGLDGGALMSPSPPSPSRLSPVSVPDAGSAPARGDPAGSEAGRNPPDVMRGEETQIAGFLAAAPGFDGVLCLPGTHAKWVQISAEEVVSFRTFMTGEMFDLLSAQSVLRHSIAGGSDDAAPLRGRVRDAFAARDAGATAVRDPGGPVAGRDQRREPRARACRAT